MIEHKIGLSGEYRCILYDNEDDMNVVEDTGWNPNLITNNGLDIYHTAASPFAGTYVGSGTNAAQITDTQLQSYIPGGQSSSAGAGDGVFGSPPTADDWEYSNTKSRRFGVGVGTGAINEIAMGASTDDSGTNIFNRVVLGATINKAANQVLDVIFRLTLWPPAVDVVGTGATVSTIAGVSYETITRMLSADLNTGQFVFSKISLIDSGSTSWRAYNGNLGLIDAAAPQGSSGDSGTGAGLLSEPYTPGDYFMEFAYRAGLNDWLPGTDIIRTLKGTTRHFNFQTQFDATVGGDPIPKDETEIMDFSWRISWDRRP
jgi:hypothetical protein